MTQDQIKKKQRKFNDRIIIGVAMVGASALLLLRTLGVEFPHFIFTWPMILIIIGLVTGFKDGFRNHNWWILIAIGMFFLISRSFPDLNIGDYFWSALLLAVGLSFILGKRTRKPLASTDTNTFLSSESITSDTTGRIDTGDDIIDAAAIFGSVKKNIYSKNFKGGEIVNVFGGSEINLMHADFSGQIKLEIVNIFGGTTLIVPPHWQIRSEAAAILGAIEDKRREPAGIDMDKVLIIEGTVIFGGIDIKSA
jgi:predicted membrane protein